MRLSDSRKSFLFSCLISLICFCSYVFTAAPDIYPGANHGELSAVASCLGIAHPTGYPLWSILGVSSKFLPLGNTAYRLHILTSCFNAVIIFIFYNLLYFLLNDLLISLITTLLIAWEPLFWEQATASEVYGLHLLLMTLLVFILHKAIVNYSEKWIYLSYFLFGLCLTNHLISIFIFPLLLIPIVKYKQFLRVKTLINISIFFLISLSLYIYLPIRSLQSPLIEWQNPSDFPNFISHVSGSEFQELMWSLNISTTVFRLKTFLKGLFVFPRYIYFSISLIGIFISYKNNKQKNLFFIAFLLLTTIFIITYNIHDIETYVLPLIWTSVYFAGYGFLYLKQKINRFKSQKIILVFIGITIGIYSFFIHFQDMNRQEDYLLKNYGLLMLRSCPPGTHLFFQGDNPMNSLSYLSVVEHRRSDLTIIDMNKNLKIFNHSLKLYNNPAIAISFRPNELVHKFYPHGLVYLKKSDVLYKPVDETFLTSFEKSLLKIKDESYFHEIYADYFIKRAEFEAEFGNSQKSKYYFENAIEHAYSKSTLFGYIVMRMTRRGYLSSSLLLEADFIKGHNYIDPSFYNNYAYHLYFIGDLKKAFNMASKAFTLSPEDPNYEKTYLKILLALKGTETSEYISLFEKYPEIYNELKFLLKIKKKKFQEKTLSIPEITKNVSFAKMFSAICAQNNVWLHTRLITQNLVENNQIDSNTLSMYVTASIKTNCIPAAISVLEDKLKTNNNFNVINALMKLHKKMNNIARYRELKKNSLLNCPDIGQPSEYRTLFHKQ